MFTCIHVIFLHSREGGKSIPCKCSLANPNLGVTVELVHMNSDDDLRKPPQAFQVFDPTGSGHVDMKELRHIVHHSNRNKVAVFQDSF